MSAHRPINLSNAAFKGLLGVAVAGGAVLPLAPSLANAASVRKEFIVEAPPAAVWDALRDFAAVDKRLARGFVVSSRFDGEARFIAFANGTEAKELLVDIDDDAMRLVYSAVSPRLIAHSASAQLYAEGGGRTRLVWIADFLPNDLKLYIDAQMEAGAKAMKQTLEDDAK